MEKFENKIIDMRDSYHDWKERGSDVTHTQHTVDATRTRTGEHVIVVRRGVVLVRLSFACFLLLTLNLLMHVVTSLGQTLAFPW